MSTELNQQKTILITGSTDGIGLETARMLVALGHRVLLHGRNSKKLEAVSQELGSEFGESHIQCFSADLSQITEVEELAVAIKARCKRLDALVNNAGVFVVANPITPENLDVRFVVNTIAPYLLTKRLLSILDRNSRVINLSSAAQSRVNLDALAGKQKLSDGEAYAQSKLALTMWSNHLAKSLGHTGPSIIAINPGSFLGSKMVQEAYGQHGKDLRIGAEILKRAVLDEEFASANGQYFDNDLGSFSTPHADAIDDEKNALLINTLDSLLITEYHIDPENQ